MVTRVLRRFGRFVARPPGFRSADDKSSQIFARIRSTSALAATRLVQQSYIKSNRCPYMARRLGGSLASGLSVGSRSEAHLEVAVLIAYLKLWPLRIDGHHDSRLP